MDLHVKINRVEFDKAQAVHRYYMSSNVADVVIELPKKIKRLNVGAEGRIILFKYEKQEVECENGLLLYGKVLSLQDENRKAILSFGGLIALITLKKEAFSDISEGSSVCLCMTGFDTW